MQQETNSVLPGQAFPRASSFLDKMKKMSKMDLAQSGDEMVGDYIIGEKLGQGSFGKVMLGTHIATKQKVALKFIDYSKTKSQKERDNIKREVRLMQLLDHPNIVKLLEVIEQNQVTCIVLEYISGGELFDYIVSHRRLKEPEAIRFFRQVVQGIEYCHSNLVIHRDLKPENLLLDSNNNIKINDFGLSNTMQPGSFLNTYCGSPLYSSPEIILETSYIGPEVDVWALGVILYAMVTGYLPWDGDTLKQQVHNAVKAIYEVPPHVSPDCKDLISRCLCVDPKARATIAEIRQHAWLSKGYNAPPPSCNPSKREIKETDPVIIEKLVDLGFTKAEVENDLHNNRTTKQSFVLYFLLADKKAKQEAEQMRIDELNAKNTGIGIGAMKTPTMTRKSNNNLFSIPEDGTVSSSPPITPIVELRGSTATKSRNSDKRNSWGPQSLALAQANLANANGNPNVPNIGLNQSQGVTTNTAPMSPISAKTPRKSIFKLFTKKDRPDSAPNSPQNSPKVSRKGETAQQSHLDKIAEEDKNAQSVDSYPTQTRQRRATIDMGEAPNYKIQVPDIDKNLRVSKGAFTVETTTMKPVAQIKEEIERVFGVLNMTFKHTKKGAGYSCKLPNSKVDVDIEICKVDKLEGIKGIKLKRASGDVWEYKEVYQKIISELKL